MGLKVKASVVSLVLITLAVLMSCSTTEPDPPPPPYVVTDSTVIIPPEEQEAILDYTPEGVLVLDPASALADSVQVGDILIGRNDEFAYAGFLRKVTAIERQRDGLFLDTEFAQLVEAFLSLNISECYQLRLSDIRECRLREGVTLNRGRDDDLFGFSLDKLLFDLDGNEGTVHDQIAIDGSYDFTAKICLEIESHLLSLERFEIGLTTVAEADIDLTAEVQWEFADELTFTLGTLYLGCITFDGIIYVVPTLTLAVHIDGDLTVTLMTSLHYEERLRNAVGWSDSQGPYHEEESEPIFTCTPPELTATCNFDVGPSLRLACLLYGFAGPYIEGYLALEFEGEIGSDPCEPDLLFSLDGCLYANLGLQCEILDLDLPPLEYSIYCQPIDDSPWIFDLDGTGTIYIDPNPGHLNAPWTLTGPCSFLETGHGDETLEDLLPGEYTVTWGSVADWTNPPEQTQTLETDGVLTFTGTYLQGGAGFVHIDAGDFIMGAPSDEYGSTSHEHPQHSVTLTHDFFLQATEVTNQQYADLAQWALDQNPPLVTATSSSLRDAMSGSTQELLDLDGGDCEISFNGSYFIVDPGKNNHPVVEVTWFGSAAYCDWLSLYEGLPRAYDHSTWQCNGNSPYTATGYRLPTEAEWEYACRAESTTPFNTGNCLDAGTEANYDGNYPYPGCPSGPNVGWSVPVGSYPENAWGLYDMHGNLYEWCNDRYHGYYYLESPGTDPVGPLSGSEQVLRGGNWITYARYCRCAYRAGLYPNYCDGGIGFRPARSAF